MLSTMVLALQLANLFKPARGGGGGWLRESEEVSALMDEKGEPKREDGPIQRINVKMRDQQRRKKKEECRRQRSPGDHF